MRAPGGANMRTVAEPPGAQGGPAAAAPDRSIVACYARRPSRAHTYRILGHRPEILAAWHQLLVSILGTGGVDPQLKMLAF